MKCAVSFWAREDLHLHEDSLPRSSLVSPTSCAERRFPCLRFWRKGARDPPKLIMCFYGRASVWAAARWKTRQNGALQPNVGGVTTALMKRNVSSAEGGVWISPQNWMISRSV